MSPCSIFSKPLCGQILGSTAEQGIKCTTGRGRLELNFDDGFSARGWRGRVLDLELMGRSASPVRQEPSRFDTMASQPSARTRNTWDLP
jgi:hypothetical protein